MIRGVLIAVFSIFLSASGKAAVFEVTSGEYYVVGDFAAYDAEQGFSPGSGILGSISFTILGGGAPVPGIAYDPLNGPFYGYELTVSANNFARVQACSFSQIGSMCGRDLEDQPSFIVFPTSSDIGELDIGISDYSINTTPLDVVAYVALPDGFVIDAVPEPSTWTMLLIGFATIGFVWRLSPSRQRQIHRAAAH